MSKRHVCKLPGFGASGYLYRAEGRERDVSNTTNTSLLRASPETAKVHHGAERSIWTSWVAIGKPFFAEKKERLIQPVHANLARTRFENCVHPSVITESLSIIQGLSNKEEGPSSCSIPENSRVKADFELMSRAREPHDVRTGSCKAHTAGRSGSRLTRVRRSLIGATASKRCCGSE